MKRIIPVAIAVLLVGLCFIAAGYFCHYYYTLYRYTALQLKGALESRVDSMEGRVGRLEAQPRQLIPEHVRGRISTGRRSPSDLSTAPTSVMSSTNSQLFHVVRGKGTWIDPEFVIPEGSSSLHEFDIQLDGPRFGTVVDGWLVQAEPYDALAAFDEFRVYPRGTNAFRLVVQAKPGSRINLEFEVVVLRLCRAP